MRDLTVAGGLALGRMPLADQKLIRPDWHAVLKYAVSIMQTDGLRDGTIEKTLARFDMGKRYLAEQNAYKRLLTEYFLFGPEAQEESRKRMAQRREDGF